MRTGETLPSQTYRITRIDLERYAQASGDPNPIHLSDDAARSVGLPGVIAHGMFTMALVARALDTWSGAPGRVREVGCKFTRPVVVPEGEQGTEVTVSATVQNVTDSGVHLSLTVTCAGEKVLGAPKAVLAPSTR